MPERPKALVLAGSRGRAEPLAVQEGVPHKALIVLNGATLLAHVIAALRASGIERIVVSCSDPAVRAHAVMLGTETIEAAAGPSMSVARALDAIGAPLVVTTADHALLRPEWIAGFLDDVPPDADVAALLAERRVIEAAAPETTRTYLKFGDGAWSGCNLFYLATPQAAAAVVLWRQVEADRKAPWRIVRRLGPMLLLRYLAGRLTLNEAVGHLGARAGIRAAAVASAFGLAAIDVDKASDLDLVRRLTR